MTTPPVQPEPQADMENPDTPGDGSGDDLSTPEGDGRDGNADGDRDSTGADPMGIDDDDPIDATLVGSPVEADRDDDETAGA